MGTLDASVIALEISLDSINNSAGTPIYIGRIIQD